MREIMWFAQTALSQEVPPTAGQPVKEPMFIPVALGLLGSNGKDIPLSSVYHDGTLETIESTGQPVHTTVLRVTKVRPHFFFNTGQGINILFVCKNKIHNFRDFKSILLLNKKYTPICSQYKRFHLCPQYKWFQLCPQYAWGCELVLWTPPMRLDP